MTKGADDDQIPVAAVADGQQWKKEFLCKDNLKDSSVSATKYRWISTDAWVKTSKDVSRSKRGNGGRHTYLTACPQPAGLTAATNVFRGSFGGAKPALCELLHTCI